jgi:glutamyl/glutaminyl-tRNA synthetase
MRQRHAEVAHAMLASGHAYRCYMTQASWRRARGGAARAAAVPDSKARGATARPTRRARTRPSWCGSRHPATARP